jgi:hypothetical protein
MSKKYLVMMAQRLASQRPVTANFPDYTQWEIAYEQWLRAKDAVADVCAASNPRFDRDRFNLACHGRANAEKVAA